MRPEDADRYRVDYICARDQRYAIRSPSLSITGSVSSCCRAQIFDRFGALRCFACRQPCTESTWDAPRNGAATRGGWNGGATREQTIAVHETRSPLTGAEDARRARAWDAYRDLEKLFVRPAGATRPDWDRLCSAWDRFLAPQDGGYLRAAELGGWTESNVREWVREGRQIVIQRLTGIPARQRAARPKRDEAIERIRERIAGNG